jgi:hypothetical protein
VEAVSRAHGASFLLLPSIIRSRYYEFGTEGTGYADFEGQRREARGAGYGANRGIGLEIAGQLCRRGLQVVIGSRDPKSGEQGVDTPVWLATLPDGGPSGGAFEERKPIDW